MNRRLAIASASTLLLVVSPTLQAQVLDTAPPAPPVQEHPAPSTTAEGGSQAAPRTVIVPGSDAPNGAEPPTTRDPIGTDLLAITSAGTGTADAAPAANTAARTEDSDTAGDNTAAADIITQAENALAAGEPTISTSALPVPPAATDNSNQDLAPSASTGSALPDNFSDSTADPRTVMMAIWRERVMAGDTELGFEEWLAATLDLQSPPADDVTSASEIFTSGDTAAAMAESDQGADSHDARTRAMSERWQARAGPVALGRAGRVVTVFGSAIPTAFCSPLTVCTIELEPGEELTDAPSWGDAVRWQVVAKKQGENTVLLEVKPAGDAEITNLVIPTDRRLYTIKLINDPEVHTPILAFSYPDSLERELVASQAAEAAERQAQADARALADRAARARQNAELNRAGIDTETGAVAAAELDFGFRVDGRAPFKPVRVFADGDRTYIDLPPSYRGALPAIVAGPNETNAALNTRVAEDGTRLIADRVIADIYLQSGKQRVRVRRDES